MDILQKKIFAMLMESQYWPPETMLAYQRNQLSQFLHHARAHVPFYKDRLDPVFKKDGGLEWECWHEVPILTRADVKANGEALLSGMLPIGHGPSHRQVSSGTTGEPVTIHTTYLMNQSGSAAFTRASRWYGGTDADRYCVAMNPTALDSLDRGTWAVAIEATGAIEGNLSSGRMAVGQSWLPERILSFMERHGSNCFSGVCTTLEDVAAAQLRSRGHIGLRFMVGISMALTERNKLLARQAFNAFAYSAYSSKEADKIAHECPVSGSFHVNGELMLLEIVDDLGKPCRQGESGRVIVTPFFGTAQPLIRYEQGDLATWGKPCACGHSHPVIAKIEGRIRNRFCFPGGHKFTPAVNYEPYRDLLKADKWQVAQTGPLNIEVRFISSAPEEAIDYSGMTRIYREEFHKDVNITYRKVESMPLTAGGKFIDYVNEYQS
jgi:phenylacetate-CoA ligase